MRRKVDIKQFILLTRAGKTGAEIAKELGVAKSRVSYWKNKLDTEISKSSLTRHAPDLIDDRFNPRELLAKIIKNSNTLLERVMQQIEAPQAAAEPSGQAAAEPSGQDGSEPKSEEKGDRKILVAVRLMQEIRGEIDCALEMYKLLFDSKSVMEFQQEVLAVISEVDPSVRLRILDRLQERRSVRTILEFPH